MNDHLRRRSVGAPAARSMLLTVLGEYVLPRHGGDGVWQEALVRSLEGLGYSTQASRQALARSTRQDWLRTERHGRRARMVLSEATAQLLRDGTDRIYTFGKAADWDEHWLLLVLRVPEERRDIRHRLRTRLEWAGLGSLGGGLWISPHASHEDEVRAAVAEEPIADATIFLAELGALGDPQRLVADAWELAAVADAYRTFIEQFSRLRPSRPEDVFRAQTELVHAWRKFPFLDPDLPAELLPPRWPKQRAHDLFHDRHGRWKSDAVAQFETFNDVSRAAA